MDVLLVLNNENARNLRVIVRLMGKELKEKVISLLEEDRGREAFDILKTKAEVQAYVPSGTQPPGRSVLLTLNEDML